MTSHKSLIAGSLLALLLVAGCSDRTPNSRTMETTPAGSSAGQAQPARDR